jgi:acyl carrier protein
MKYALVIVGFIVFVYLFALYESRQKRKRIQSAFKDRDALSVKAFYEKYYLAKDVSLNTVKGVRKVLEEQLGCDLSQLSSGDDFSNNLSFFWDFDSMASVEIVMALEEHFSIKIEDLEAERLIR